MSPENPQRGSKTRVLTEGSLLLLISYLNTLSMWGDNGVPFRLHPDFKPILTRIQQMKSRCGSGVGRSLLDPGEEFEDAQEALIAVMPRGNVRDPVKVLGQVMENVDAYVEAQDSKGKERLG